MLACALVVTAVLAAPQLDRVPAAPDADGATALPAPRIWDRPVPLDAASFGHGPARAGDAGDVTFISVDESPEGDMPRNVAYTPDGSAIVIVHRDTDNVTFFDTATNAPTHTVAVGDFPVDVAVTPDGRYAVVPNVLDHTVSLIDVATHALAATVPVTGEQPYRVAVTPDSRFAVVGVINDGISSAFSVIDLELREEVLSIPSGPQGVIGFFFTPEAGLVGNIFTQFALAPDGATIVLPDRGNARVLMYDRATGAEVADLATADQPTAIDVSPDGSTAVVSHEGAVRTITVIDVPGRSIVRAVGTTSNLTAQVIRITHDETYALAAISNNLIFVNLITGATDATISTGSVGDIEISFDGVYAFVSNFNARVIDIATRTLVRTITYGPCVDAAASPVERRAVALNNRFRENVHFYDIDGASGFLESAAVSGVPVEGDVPYGVDISEDGAVAVSCNLVSGNVAIIDVPGRTIRSFLDVGDRLKEVRITPDGTHAVVCAMDANDVVIIDLATDEEVARLTISNRPGRVRIAPDSTEAYVLNVAGSDRISFIALDGADSSIVAQLSAGQTGVANGPTYTETSGIELSDDGATLAVCDSFNDLLRLYDTQTRTQVAAVPVGDFPLRVAFSPDGTRAYVVNHFSDDVTVVSVDGGNSQALATVTGVARYPLTVTVGPAGEYVYVGTRSSGGGSNAVRVIDTASNTIVRTIGLGDGSPRDSALDAARSVLLVLVTDGTLARLDAAGAGTTILDSTPLSAGAPDMSIDASADLVVVAQPVPDGVDIVSFAPCPGDVDGNRTTDFDDLLAVLAAWGPYDPCPPFAPEDVDESCDVGFDDLLAVLSGWGPCR